MDLIAHLALSDPALALAIYAIGAASGFALARLLHVWSK